MNTLPIILGIFTAITSLIAAIASLYGVFQKRRIETLSLELKASNRKLNNAKNELYKVYLNVAELLRIESELSKELEMGKITIRRGYNTNRYIQPKHVETRIKQLEIEI